MRRTRTWILLAAAAGAVIPVTGCLEPVDPPGAPVSQDGETGQIFITDRTGRAWDVSHAVAQYGFVPEEFQFGLGPDAIRPVFDPSLAGPGDPGYPAAVAQTVVVGTNLGDDPRAYSLTPLTRHEIVNEHFPDAHVAVAY